jgi:leader peptidase (prepilin peptidase)/N-methyltransferase
MIRLLGTIFAGLLGLAFGSFLNVCLSRWPEGESIVAPRSHCRNCTHTLAWWENIPLLSWLLLRGRCRQCHTWIGWRYPLVEAVIGCLWGLIALRGIYEVQRLVPTLFTQMGYTPYARTYLLVYLILFLASLFFVWYLVALSVLDLEHLWLPNKLTYPGIVMGALHYVFLAFFLYQLRRYELSNHDLVISSPPLSFWMDTAGDLITAIFISAGLILLIRWTYKLIRKREGLGLGDAKLMALLAAWLGLRLTLVAFVIAVMLGSLAAILLLVRPALQREGETWALNKLPLGTFLCIGGILSSLWGQPILNAYLRWAGL